MCSIHTLCHNLHSKTRCFVFWPVGRHTWLQVAKAFSSMGLHKGDEFRTWLSTSMGEITTSELLNRMKLSANGITLYRKVEEDGRWKYQLLDMASVEPWIPAGGKKEDRDQLPLRIVASEVTTQTKAVFPRDADLYYVSFVLQRSAAEAAVILLPGTWLAVARCQFSCCQVPLGPCMCQFFWGFRLWSKDIWPVALHYSPS